MTTNVPDRFAVCPAPDRNPHAPTRFRMPWGAVDTHAHVIGAPPDYPLIENRSYTPAPATVEDYFHMLDATGVTFAVLVQVSVHGTDNRLLMDMLDRYPVRLRGVAVAPHDLPEREFLKMKDAGVVGLRLNTLSGGGIGLDHLDSYEALCAELGWHLQFLTDTSRLEPVASRLSKLRVPYIMDHMGHFAVSDGLQSAGMQLMLKLMADGAWVKLSGAYRVSDAPGYTDTVPFARALIEAAPDRCVWGSDWPHPAYWGTMPNDGDLLDLLADWAPYEAVRNAILADNAHRLYGFPGSPVVD
jgi:predicted TIM-barrel fold metal-dependent hydrolase